MVSFSQPFFFGPKLAVKDGVHNYVCDCPTHAPIWFSFRYAVREGDGPAVILYVYVSEWAKGRIMHLKQ